MYSSSILASLPADGSVSSYLWDQSRRDDGYISVGHGTKVRIASPQYEVKELTTIGQTFESITFSRKNSEMQNDDVAGYIVRITNRADIFDTKKRVYSFYDSFFRTTTSPTKYILVLPQGIGTG